MKKIVLIYGLIAGTIVGGMMLITMPLYDDGTLNFDSGELVGYTTMVIALSLIFFGVKSFRDNHLGGVITFGKALKVGLLITLIASVMYGLAWEVTYNLLTSNFTEKMTEHYINELKEDGASAEVIAAEKAKWESFSEYYKNPIIRFTITMVVEIMPVGIVIALISAALLRRKEFLPVRQAA